MAKNSDNVVRMGHNGLNGERINDAFTEAEGFQAEIDEILLAAQKKCEPLREKINDIKGMAADELSVPKRVFNAALSRRKKIRDAEAVREKLNEDQQETYDQVLHLLGDLADTPLGEAALEGANA